MSALTRLLHATAGRRGQPPGRSAREVMLCWVMAAVVVGAGWVSGGVMPARVVIGMPASGGGRPIAPTEENENHSSGTVLDEVRCNSRRRDEGAESDSPRQRIRIYRQASVLPVAFAAMLRGSFDGHRLSNGLMAPMQT